MINTAIIGADRYTDGTLIRLLLHHPDVTLRWVHSENYATRALTDIHPGLIGETDLRYTADIDYTDIDCVFCCDSRLLHRHPIPEDTRIIDLGDEHRIEDDTHDYIYGLSELNRKRIVRGARHIAVPGNLAAAILPALIPAAKNLLINSAVHITAITADTDTDVQTRDTAPCRSPYDSITLYRPFSHPQLAEIRQSLSQLQNSFKAPVELIPIRGSFARGTLAAIYFDCKVSLERLREIYDKYYDDHNFTFVTDTPSDIKDVIDTNKCLLHLDRINDRLLITSVIDNRMKGAAGTAVHNLNLLFGLSERIGLNLKPAAF